MGSVCCGCDEQIHRICRSPVEERDGLTVLLSEREGPNPCLDRLLLLFWAHTSRMVLIYYAQVRFRWLPFTDNKGEDVANYFKEKDICKCKGKSG